jgi:hypothetical protein
MAAAAHAGAVAEGSREADKRKSPAWKDRPFAVSRRTRNGQGLRIHAPHSGQGLVMNIHLSDVGPHAISLGHSGGVDASRMVERMAAHRLAAERSMTTPFSWSPLAYRGALNIESRWLG